MNTSFVVEFYEDRASDAPVGRVMVLEGDGEDAARVAEILKQFFDHLRMNKPQFHDAGLLCARFVHWQICEFEKVGIGPEDRPLIMLRKLVEPVDYVVAEVYATGRPEVRFRRTEETTAFDLYDAAAVLQQANI